MTRTRQPKTGRVARTRAGGTWSEAQYWAFLRSLLRQGFLRWPARRQALERDRVPYTGLNPRRRWSCQCAECGGMFRGTDVEVDHIERAGRLRSLEDLPGFVARLFCEAEGLRVVCRPCHRKITRGAHEREDEERE